MKVVHVDKSKAKRVLAEVTVHASVKEVSRRRCHHCSAVATIAEWHSGHLSLLQASHKLSGWFCQAALSSLYLISGIWYPFCHRYGAC